MVSAERVTVSTTAVALNGAESDTVSGSRLIVKNTDSADALVFGASDVTASTGFSLAAGATLDVALPSGEQLYAIRAAEADIVAHVLRIGF